MGRNIPFATEIVVPNLSSLNQSHYPCMSSYMVLCLRASFRLPYMYIYIYNIYTWWITHYTNRKIRKRINVISLFSVRLNAVPVAPPAAFLASTGCWQVSGIPCVSRRVSNISVFVCAEFFRLRIIRERYRSENCEIGSTTTTHYWSGEVWSCASQLWDKPSGRGMGTNLWRCALMVTL